jgi:hypothetical protein
MATKVDSKKASPRAKKRAPAIPRGDRLPRSDGSWMVVGKEGDTGWKSDKPEVNKITGNAPVPFKNGYPVFDKWSKGKVELPDMEGTDDDFDEADKLYWKANEDKYNSAADVARMRQREGLTWHHHQDQKTMQLIPTALLGNVPHSGGASLAREARAARGD